MFKKITLAIVALFVVALAESPVKVEKSDFWWKATKECATNLVKSVKVEFKMDAAIDLTKDGWDKTKELTGKAVDKVKEVMEDDNNANTKEVI